MKPSIRVLSVGLQQPLDMAYGSLLMGRPCEITEVPHRGELDTIQTNEGYDVAVLGEGLSKEKLIEAARLIRRRWPQANILAISAKPLNIDDTLYDDRIVSGYSAKVLVAEVLRLMGAHRRQREGAASRWEC
jgi:DNA-binding response OmpR family regulator